MFLYDDNTNWKGILTDQVISSLNKDINKEVSIVEKNEYIKFKFNTDEFVDIPKSVSVIYLNN